MEIHNKKCYFRSMPENGNKKALIQLTTKCNMKCKHCFVSAKNQGIDIDFSLFEEKILKLLKESNVERVTLTGGEPLLYQNIYDVTKLLIENEIKVTICTNGLNINKDMLQKYSELKRVEFNVSLDGINSKSYENFRGIKDSFNKVRDNIKLLSEYNLLKGILVTPNKYSKVEDYIELIDQMVKERAKFILFNPLAEMGRGKNSVDEIGVSKEYLLDLKERISNLDLDIEIILIKFPSLTNQDTNQIESCQSDKIIYIYANGRIVSCPYLDFIEKGEVLGNYFKIEELAKKNEEIMCGI